jgi:sec-independent protein translocase protein TatA
MLPNIGPMELVLLLGLGVLLFGKRLPEVGRSLGRGIVEFKKGLNGVTDEFDITSTNRYSSSSSNHGSSHRSEEPATAGSAYSDASVPKFELPGTPSNSSASASASSASASSSAPVPQMEYPPATSQD